MSMFCNDAEHARDIEILKRELSQLRTAYNEEIRSHDDAENQLRATARSLRDATGRALALLGADADSDLIATVEDVMDHRRRLITFVQKYARATGAVALFDAMEQFENDRPHKSLTR